MAEIPVFEDVIERVISAQKYHRFPEVQSELYELKLALLKIQSPLNDASHKQVFDEPVRPWLDNLQHLFYDIDDVLHDLAIKDKDRELAQESKTKSITRKVTQKLHSITNKLHDRYRLEKKKLVSITNELQFLEEQKLDLGLNVRDGKPKSSTRGVNRTSLLEVSFVGRDGEKEILLNKLLRDDPSSKENFSIVPIVGVGGIGKTTLARILYNDTRVDGQFRIRAWVCVSSEFDVLKISKTIFQSLSNVNKEFEDLNQLQIALMEKVRDRRFLLVLDDVWNENYDDWEELVRPFRTGARGSKIIMTTRKDHLLKKLGFNHIDRLEILSHEDSLSLLAIHALGVDNFDSHRRLRLRGESIAKKCYGLPLALQVIGSLLRTKDEGWDDVLNSDIWNLQNTNEIVPALKLSYHYLSSHLKWLFAYCSLFPKNFLFDKEKLVLLWLAEVHLDHPHADDSRECLVNYFETLLSMSFFQHVPDQENLFVMHDLMNDLAVFVAKDYFLKFDDQFKVADEALAKYRHMSFICEKYAGYKQFEAFKRARSLRTLLSVGVDKSWNFGYLSNKILVDVFHELPMLRVLCLSNCDICEVPDFIGSLKHLRYLSLSQTKIKELPENVGSLYYLQTLIVFGCRRLTKLPTSFLKLINLQHLDIRETPLLKKMPLWIGKLESLQISPTIIRDDYDIFKLERLKSLSGELSIEGLHNLQRPSIQHMKLSLEGITKLSLKWVNVFDSSQGGTLEKSVLEKLMPNSAMLKEFAIVSYGGTEFPNWVGGPQLLLLADISIIDCRNCTSLPPLGSLPSLKKLLIKGMNAIKFIGLDLAGENAFPKLEILVFEDMLRWEEWSINSKVLDAVFPCLRVLQLKNCPNLVDVSPEAMPSLKVLQICECGYSVLRSLVKIASSIAELEIKSISGLTDEVWRGVIMFLGAVEEVSITCCNEMRYLWESEAEASKVLMNLKKLKVFGCSDLVSLGEKENGNYGSNLLTSLRILEVWFCGSMKHCSCPYSIESLTISSCTSLTHVSFPTGGQKLKSLSLYGCHKLVENINNTSMPMLEIVNIRHWSNLKSVTELGNFTNLTCLMIQDCQCLESFPDLVLPQLTHLTLGDCQSLESFPDIQLQNCTLLKHMEITNCPNINASFPRGIWPPKLCSLEIGGLKKPVSDWGPQNFPTSLVCLKLFGEHVSNFSQLSDVLPSSLTKLHIQDFDDLGSLSTGLQRLTSLQHLGIHNCPKMEILPETLLPSLLSLEIFDCPNLKRRCNGRCSRYWPLISHIPCIDIQDGYSFVR